jgi:polysaccharide export outer membrane protein
MVNSISNRRFLEILIVLWLAAAMLPAGVVRADNDISPGPDSGQLAGGEEGTYRVQVAAYFSSHRAKKAKRKIEKDERFKGHRTVIEFSAKSGVYRVETGEFRTIEEAESLQALFFEAGYDDAEVVVDRLYGGASATPSTPPAEHVAEPGVAAAVEPAAPTGPEWTSANQSVKPVIGQASLSTQRSDYIIGPEDLLEVSVFELEGLNKTVRVSEEGMIALPLLGEVRAEGLTSRELEEVVRNLLEEKYINSPQVSVFIREFRSRSVSVIGSVQKPGTYKLLGSRTLIHMISEAGGLTENAGPELYVIRVGADDESRRITVNIEELMIQGRSELNIQVQSGDVINIPADPEISVYIYGAVRQPGQLSFKESDVISLLQAITKAGGLTDRAAADRVRVKRKSAGGGEDQIDVNLKKILKGKQEDVLLQDKDVVVVPETIF